MIVAVLVAMLLCGCNKSEPAPGPAGDCAAVGDKLVALGHDSAAALQGREKNVFATQIQLIKDDVVATCERNQWPAEARACLLAAADRAAFDACARDLPRPADAGAERVP